MQNVMQNQSATILFTLLVGRVYDKDEGSTFSWTKTGSCPKAAVQDHLLTGASAGMQTSNAFRLALHRVSSGQGTQGEDRDETVTKKSDQRLNSPHYTQRKRGTRTRCRVSFYKNKRSLSKSSLSLPFTFCDFAL